MNTKALISSVFLTLTIAISPNSYALPSASGAAGGMGHGSSAGYGGSSSGASASGSSSSSAGSSNGSNNEGQSGQSSGLSYQPYTNDWSPVDNYIAECKANGVTIGRYAALHVDIECAGD